MIPKTFTLINRTWLVRLVSSKQLAKYLDDDEIDPTALKGLCDQSRGRILINKDLHHSEEDLLHTYWHEFAHALLMATGLHTEHDEEQVDLIGAILHQYEQTKKGGKL